VSTAICVTLPVACRKYGLFDLKWGSLWAAGPQTAVPRRLKRYVREPAGSGNGDATWVHSLLARVDFGDDMVDVGPLELHFYVHGRRPYLGRAGATPQAWDTDSPDYPYTHG
jgi:hypothetical protein